MSDLVREVFGDECPVCSHSRSDDHDAFGRCKWCKHTPCTARSWSPESIERYRQALAARPRDGQRATVVAFDETHEHTDEQLHADVGSMHPLTAAIESGQGPDGLLVDLPGCICGVESTDRRDHTPACRVSIMKAEVGAKLEEIGVLTHGEEKPIAAFTVETSPDPYGTPGWEALHVMQSAPNPLLPPVPRPLTETERKMVAGEVDLLADDVFRRGSPKTPEAAAAAFDAITAEARRRHDAEAATREAAAREHLADRVSAAMEAANEETILVDWDCMANETVVRWDALADAAVEVFLEFLRNPPTMEHHTDGTTTIGEARDV